MSGTATTALKKVLQKSRDITATQKASKIGVYIKLDSQVVKWFKDLGPGYQNRMNEVLKRFVEAVGREEAEFKGPASLEKAQQLFEKYYEQCFWHMKRDLIITHKELPQIVKALKIYGGRAGYMEAANLCR